MGGDKVDLNVLNQIKTEAYQNSKVMENLFYISEVYGPRVTNSRNHRAAAEWAMKQMKEWGLQNVHLEKWSFGTGWQIKKFYGAMESPAYAAFTGFPLAWTPGTNGPLTAEPIFAPIHSKDDFAKYHGKLKGKIVLMFDPPRSRSTRGRTRSLPPRMRRSSHAVARAVVELAVAEQQQEPPALPVRQALPRPIATPVVAAVRVKAHGRTRRPRSPWQMRRIMTCATR